MWLTFASAATACTASCTLETTAGSAGTATGCWCAVRIRRCKCSGRSVETTGIVSVRTTRKNLLDQVAKGIIITPGNKVSGLGIFDGIIAVVVILIPVGINITGRCGATITYFGIGIMNDGINRTVPTIISLVRVIASVSYINRWIRINIGIDTIIIIIVIAKIIPAIIPIIKIIYLRPTIPPGNFHS